jgi:3-hydroxyisobutyrate dehydrogenase-like beta-hydroxyacid dehydrogenase
MVQAMRAAAGLAHKDLAAALELAEELGITLPVARMTDARCDAVFGVGPDPIADGRERGSEA